MNRHDRRHDLDDPSDEEVEVLHEICRSASLSTKPPFAALFTSYEDYFGARGLDTARDPSIFRWLMRVADKVRPKRRSGLPLDFVPQLKSLLQERDIWIVDPDQNEVADGITRPFAGSDSETRTSKVPVRRRVSFDDARLEETWLSDHSKSLNPAQGPAKHTLQTTLPHRQRNFASAEIPRTRPSSSQHGTFKHKPESVSLQQKPSLDSQIEWTDHTVNPSLLFDPSQTQLEQNAEAFLATSELRMARQCLHAWLDQSLMAKGQRQEALGIAAAHDRRTLLKQSLDILHVVFQQRRAEDERESRLRSILKNHCRRRDRWLLAKAFSHWDESAQHQKRATAVAQRHAMKVKYFRRWRRIAVENATKVRNVLVRRHFTCWQEQATKHAMNHECATAQYERSALKTCFQHLFWTFCSRRVKGWHEKQVEHRLLNRWHAQWDEARSQQRQAEDTSNRNAIKHGLHQLVESFRHRQALQSQAQQYSDHRLKATSAFALFQNAKLAPVARNMLSKTNANLKLKTIRVWQLNLSLLREAAAVDRKRILQSAWTNWNESLRCRALTQQIDERILIECLYKWVLQERLRLFQKARDLRVLRITFSKWRSECNGAVTRLDGSLAAFKEQERQRRLRSAMLRLYGAFRSREEAERIAMEHSNGKALPSTLHAWSNRAAHAQKLARWADDARYYCLSTNTLRTWREKTSEHKHNRRREAYAQVRSRTKLRIVRHCFTRWHDKTTSLHSLYEEAVHRQQARIMHIAVQGFDTWHERAAQHIDQERQAAAVDREKLQASAFSMLASQQAEYSALDAEASAFSQESRQAQALVALKRVQWATFNAARRAESADALWARSRDQHIRHMLRHLASRAAESRAAKARTVQLEPESPSLRPASRIAARSETLPSPKQPEASSATPAYMRTPARPRRSGRFKPLPTPMAVTPMAFDPAYYAATPAPLRAAAPSDAAEEPDSVFEGLTPQITPFARKLRAGGVTPAVPPSALRSSVFGTIGNERFAGGTSKSVRFVRSSRFSGGRASRGAQ